MTNAIGGKKLTKNCVWCIQKLNCKKIGARAAFSNKNAKKQQK